MKSLLLKTPWKTKKQEGENKILEKETAGGTIFDDVFRTIAQKMPFLLIPLINEVFGTDYSEDREFEQLRNEHYEKFGKVITDSIIRIGGHIYHIECQSERDGSMMVRMMEYDFAIALEHPSWSEDGMMEINFPESCVLYIRNHRNMSHHHEMRVKFPDGQTVLYRVPVVMAGDYTVDRIFEKRLLLLLPYHILRYERFLKSNRVNKKKLEQLMNDYQEINERLCGLRENEENEVRIYVDLIELIDRIAEYVIPKDNPLWERIGEVMGGQVFELRSERLKEEGRREGRIHEIYSMVRDGDTTPECAAKRLGITVPVLRDKMEAEGYRYPQT